MKEEEDNAEFFGTIDGGKVALLEVTYTGKVDGLTEGAFGTQDLADDPYGTIDQGKSALLDDTCVDEVDGMTENALWEQILRPCR